MDICFKGKVIKGRHEQRDTVFLKGGKMSVGLFKNPWPPYEIVALLEVKAKDCRGL